MLGLLLQEKELFPVDKQLSPKRFAESHNTQALLSKVTVSFTRLKTGFCEHDCSGVVLLTKFELPVPQKAC